MSDRTVYYLDGDWPTQDVPDNYLPIREGIISDRLHPMLGVDSMRWALAGSTIMFLRFLEPMREGDVSCS
jgi:hypothetical protein